MTTAEKILRAKADIDAVYEAGKAQGGGGEFDAFKNMDSINSFFANNYNSYYLDKLDKLDLSNIKRAQYLFQENTIVKSVKIPSMPNLALIHAMFLRCTSVEYIEVDTSLANAVSDLFNGCTSLKEIGKPLDFSKASYLSRTFQDCSELEKITFVGTINKSVDFYWSTKLTADSLNSIITHLSDSATGQTITLPTTAESTYNAKYGDGAWATLLATKQNWSIAYA
jgi:hypothetical protein